MLSFFGNTCFKVPWAQKSSIKMYMLYAFSYCCCLWAYPKKRQTQFCSNSHNAFSLGETRCMRKCLKTLKTQPTFWPLSLGFNMYPKHVSGEVGWGGGEAPIYFVKSSSFLFVYRKLCWFYISETKLRNEYCLVIKKNYDLDLEFIELVEPTLYLLLSSQKCMMRFV